MECGFLTAPNPLDTCPQTDPLSDSLADFSEAERDVAMSRFQALRPHVQDGATLTETAVMANVPASRCATDRP